MREGLLDHSGRVFVDANFLKCWLSETALAFPKFSFAVEQTVAEKRPHDRLRQRAFAEFMLLDDQHLLDEIGAVEQNSPAANDGKRNHIAIIVSGANEESEQISANIKKKADEEFAARARRKSCGVFGAWHFHVTTVNTTCLSQIKPEMHGADVGCAKFSDFQRFVGNGAGEFRADVQSVGR